MSKPILLQDDFSMGQKPDLPRDSLPKGAVHRVTDFLVDRNAPLRKRGGYDARWDDTSGVSSSLAAVGFAPFAGFTSQVVAIRYDNAALYSTTFSTAAMTSRGTAVKPLHCPVFYREKLYIPDGSGAAVPKVYDSSFSLANLSGSPPSAMLAGVYKDHLVLARSTAEPRRIWFSSGGDPTSWDTSADGQWLDASNPVTGIATLRGMILVFEEGGLTERIRGDIIPGVVGSDFVREPLFGVGSSDPASIAVTDDRVVFANAAGIYMTDGTSIVDLTQQGHNKYHWQSLMSSYSSTWTIAGSIWNGKYVCSVTDNSGGEVVTMVVDIDRRVFSQFVTGTSFTQMLTTPTGVVDTPQSIVGSHQDRQRLADLTTMFTKPGDDGYVEDADVTAVRPTLETPYYLLRPGMKRWRNLYVRAKINEETGSLVYPSLWVYRATDSAATSYTQLGTSFTTTTATQRKKLPISTGTMGGIRSEGIALKFAQSWNLVNANDGRSQDTAIWSIEADVMPEEASKL